MGSGQSTPPGTQVPLGQRVNTGALNLASGINTAAQTTTQLAASIAQLGQATAPALNTLRLAMANIQRAQGATYGGRSHEGYFGGDDDADPAKGLREYESSLSAQAKEDTIRRIARALNGAGINVDAEGDLDAIVQGLVKQIPNPKNGKTFSSDAEAQKKVCNVIAEVLNNEFTPGVTKAADKFIDTSLGPVAVCRDVARWAHSFASGINTEFLAVHASVRNALRSIEILDEIMSEIWAKIRSSIEDAKDPALGRKVDPLGEVYTRAQNERRKMEEYLKNVLHVQLAPAAKELEIAMRDESDQNALIKKLGLKPGTSEFADALAMAVSSLGTVASIAERVHKALKQVGLSVKQYVDSPDFAEFERMLDTRIESGNVKAEDLAKFLEAINTLRSAFDERKGSQFRAALESESARGGRRGGADEEKSSVEKRAEQRETEKKVILKDFAGRMTRHYEELLSAIKAIGPKLGKEVPLTDKSDALRDALTRLRDMSSDAGNITERIELALIGLYMDADARARKEQFVSALRVVSAACASLMELEMYRPASAYLARVKAAIDAIEKTVDYFADVIAKKYGGNGPTADDLVDLGVEGGAKGGVDPSSYLPEIARSGLSLGQAVSEFAYFYYVARVRANMEQTSKELETYGEKYIDLLGDAVAARLFTLEKERSDIMAQTLTTANRPYIFNDGGAADRAAVGAGNARGTPGWLGFGGLVASQAFPATPDGDAAFTRAQKWVADEYDIKAKFYRALQAMDLYMKAFTAAIVKDPDSVKNIKKILDGTQVIARWFSDQTGESVWKAFEFMGATDFNGGKVPAVVGDAVLADANPGHPHYYDKVAAGIIANANAVSLGVPACGVPPGMAAAAQDRAAQAKKNIADAYEYFQALKNLVNAFARIGDSFGGRELRAQVFMSPTQIYKTLIDYLKQSALSINKTGAAVGAPGVSTPNADVIAPIVGASAPFQVFFATVEGGSTGNYVLEDRYFVLIVNAMAAKVMTTLGVFDMFERTSPLYDLTPTRMIVGGADADADPEVIEGAAELYFRLIRLAEFYRVFLRWDGSGNDPLRIAMLPELEGVFAGLIRLIFQKAVSPEEGDYSDTELRTIVRETNSIYEHFGAKSSGRANQAALAAFVMEINRRFGVIKQKDMKSYMDMIKLTRRSEYGTLNNTNYAILPGEEETDIDRRAPSDRFVLPSGQPSATASPFAGRTGLDLSTTAMGAVNSHKQMLRKFRTDLDEEFSRVDKNQFGKTSYALLIKQAEAEIRRASTREAKLAVAFKLIQGTSVVGTDANKAFMFHETVVVGLNMLNTLEVMIRRLDARISAMNPRVIENAIMDAIYLDATGAGGVGAVGAPGNRAQLIAMVAARLPQYATAPAAPTTIFDRYVWANASFLGRSGTPISIPAGVAGPSQANLFNFLGQEYAAFAGAALPAAPSTFTDVTPGGLNAVQTRMVQALRLFARLMTDYGTIMRDFAENAFDLSNLGQGLVEMRFTQGPVPGVQFGFGKLRGLIESLLSDVKYFMDMFRPFMSRETIERFESRTILGAANGGSVFWLEEHLIDLRIRGTDADPDQRQSLDGIGRRASAVFTDLVRQTHVQLGAIITAAGLTGNAAARLLTMPNPPAADDTRYEDYGQTFSELVFYNAVDYVSRQTGLVLAGGADNEYDLGALIRAVKGAPAAPAPAGGAADRFLLYRSEAGMTRSRSLMFAFNQLVARFLNTFTDTAGGQKIYLNLINAFANGVASRSVTSPSGYGYPDLALAGEAFGARGDPKGEAVLFQSLGYILQRLIKDVNATTQVPDHTVATLTDVPLYMKEAMRANLSSFIKFFDLLTAKGDFLKQLFQKTAMRLRRPSQLLLGAALKNAVLVGANVKIVVAANQERVPAANQYVAGSLDALETLSGPLTSDEMKARLVSIIDAVTMGAYTLSTTCSEVLKELGDNPVYFQTGEGSIETYKMRYGKLPLMPLSLSLWYLSDLQTAGAGVNDTKVLPVHMLGMPKFKIVYGHRQLIPRSTPVTFEQIPGVKASLDAYNGVTGKREQIEEGRYLRFIQNVTATLRYAVEARNFKSMLSTSNALFSTPTLFDGGLRDTAGPALGNAVYALHGGQPPPAGGAISEQVVLTVVESSNQDEEAGKITERVGGAGAGIGTGRKMERIYNLIDMGIMPINFHALMRDMPLANLYNYEFTFEQMVAAMFGEPSPQYTSGTIDDGHTRTTKQLLLRLLVDPYMSVAPQMYGSDTLDLGSAGFVHRILRGDNNLGMGRPKFLSDQLGNKPLFVSIYQSRADFDEAGPAVGIGMARGTDVSPGPIQNTQRILGRVLAAIAADLATFLGPAGAGNAGGLAAAVAAAGPAPGPANIRGRVYDLIFNPSGLAARIDGYKRVLDPLPATLPNPPQNAVQAIVDELDGGGGGAHDWLDLLAVITALGVSKAARIGAGGFDAAVDALFLTEYDPATGGSIPALITATLLPATVNGVAEQVAVETAGAHRSTRANIAWQPRTIGQATISYLQAPPAGQPDDAAVVEVNLPSIEVKMRLEAIGKARFDTKFVRNIFLIVNVVRLLRLKLNRELTQSRNVLVASHMAVAPGVTEYGSDPFSPNEDITSTLPGGWGRFNDRDTY